jgi:hypothetical protein
VLTLLGNISYGNESELAPCHGEKYNVAVKRLKKFIEDDERDRKNFQGWTDAFARDVHKRDLIRRIGVAGLFARGCLKSPEDYLNAARVFQHGEVPDHYFQSFIWGTRAFKMGKKEGGQIAGNSIDRYLMNLGLKQLYGGQAKTEKGLKSCYCLWPVESTFPDEMRTEMGFPTQKDLLNLIRELNKGKKDCSNTVCQVEAKAVPRGTLPGFW